MSILSLFCAGIVHAGTYYVSPHGTETWENAGNIQTPCSLDTAMDRAEAGDTVYFRGGTYNIPYSDVSSWVGLISPSHGGTEGSPITFIAYPDETPIFNVSGNWGSDDFVMCFATGVGHSYITLDGFTIQGAGGTKATGVAAMYDHGARPQGCIFRNLTINGGTNIIQSSNNREGIRLDGTDNALVQNCYIYNFRQQIDWHNTSGIKMYDNNGTTIENCEIYNCSCGMYVKRANNGCIFRYNYVHHGSTGFEQTTFTLAENKNSHRNKYYHNVIADMSYMGIRCLTEDTSWADNIEIYQNTVYDCKYGVVIGRGSGWKVYNNIFMSKNTGGYKHACLQTTGWEVAQRDHNQYGNSPSLVIIKNWETQSQVTYNTLNDWKNSGVCTNVGQGSLVSDPKFLNSSGNMNQLDDFRLASESPCKNAGYGGVDMGADISQVGTGSQSPPGSPPGAPPWFE